MENQDSVLRISRIFMAPREKVFKAWTDPQEMEKWYGPEGVTAKVPELELKVGGKYRVVFSSPDGKTHIAHGEFKEIVPPEKLVFSWQWEGTEMGTEETTVAVELKEKDGGTEVSLTHSNFKSKESRDHHNEGWSSSFNKLGKI